MKDYSGLETFQSEQVMCKEILGRKVHFQLRESGKRISKRRKVYRHRVYTKIFSLMFDTCEMVQRICGEFLADMWNDLSSPTFCAVIGTFLLE